MNPKLIKAGLNKLNWAAIGLIKLHLVAGTLGLMVGLIAAVLELK